jgi:hypothetical protein
MFGVQPHERLQGWSEHAAYEDKGNVVLPVSLRVALLIIGGQLFGFSHPQAQRMIIEGSGLNVKEFFASRVCPLCFPFPDPEEGTESSVDTDDEEDEEENDFDEDFEDDSDKPVKVLKISADGSVTPLTVCGLADMKEQSEMVADSDSYYLRDLGVYFWYDGYAQQKNLKLNVYCSVLSGSPVRGDVVVIGDITKSLQRSRDWEDLPEDWFDHRLLEVISLANMEDQVLELVTELFS